MVCLDASHGTKPVTPRTCPPNKRRIRRRTPPRMGRLRPESGHLVHRRGHRRTGCRHPILPQRLRTARLECAGTYQDPQPQSSRDCCARILRRRSNGYGQRPAEQPSIPGASKRRVSVWRPAITFQNCRLFVPSMGSRSCCIHCIPRGKKWNRLFRQPPATRFN